MCVVRQFCCMLSTKTVLHGCPQMLQCSKKEGEFYSSGETLLFCYTLASVEVILGSVGTASLQASNGSK